MRKVVAHGGWGALLGAALVTAYAVGTLYEQPTAPPLLLGVVYALLLGGLLIGAPAGFLMGALVGVLRRHYVPPALVAARAELVSAEQGRWEAQEGRRWAEQQAQRETAEAARGVTRREQAAANEVVRLRREQQQERADHAQAEQQSLADVKHLKQQARAEIGRLKAAAQPTGAAPLAPIRPAPERPTAPPVDLADPQRVNKVLAELDALVGLEPVASRVREMAARVRSDERRRQAGLATAEQGLHLVFTGPPGVGKTEVANIWGRVLYAAGLLPKDEVMVVKREDLVGQHIGSTAIKTGEVIDRAMGGTLFIDEAYTLAATGGGGPDFGQEAITTLLARMEESRGHLAVIVAGYPADMDRFLTSNAGLQSRFEEVVDFPAYSAHALTQIAQSMAQAKDYNWTEDAVPALHKAFQKLVAAPPAGWANARSVRKILGAAATAQGRRLGEEEPSPDLSNDDAKTALTRLYPQAT